MPVSEEFYPLKICRKRIRKLVLILVVPRQILTHYDIGMSHNTLHKVLCHIFFVYHSIAVFIKNRLVPFPLVDELSPPREPPQPHGVVLFHLIGIGDISTFGQGYHLAVSHFSHIPEAFFLRGMIIFLYRINIIAADVKRVGVYLHTLVLPVPYPYKIGQLMIIFHTVKNHIPQLLIRFTVLFIVVSPPEPVAVCLVQRPPQHRYIKLCHTLKLG